MNTSRLFTPPGPQVTSAEAAQRRREHLAAQTDLFDTEPAQHSPAQPCPACTSTEADHECAHDAPTLL